MTRQTTLLDPKDPVEVDVVTFDFTDMIASTDTINDADVDVVVVSGTDATPASILSGSRQIQGRAVLQQVANGLPGVQYEITVKVTMESGRVLVLSGTLPVANL